MDKNDAECYREKCLLFQQPPHDAPLCYRCIYQINNLEMLISKFETTQESFCCHSGLSRIFLLAIEAFACLSGIGPQSFFKKDSRQAPIEARLHTGQAGMTKLVTLFFNPSHICTELQKLLFHLLISSIKVINPVYSRLSLCCEGCNDK
jgi:hypothetical protein